MEQMKDIEQMAESATRRLLDYYLATGGEGFNSEVVVELFGAVDVDENEGIFHNLGSFLCGMKILCISNNGANGVELYLRKDWDCTFYCLSQAAQDSAIVTKLEKIQPYDAEYFIDDEELYFVVERMRDC